MQHNSEIGQSDRKGGGRSRRSVPTRLSDTHEASPICAKREPKLKRLTDVFLSTLLLFLLAPLLLIVAGVVASDRHGPVFFRQRRTGRNGVPFDILKFRTMNVCEDGDAVRQACSADPRITKIGSFLRKTSIDELPQLINVLRGEMSLVGPRPHAITHDMAFASIEDRYWHRFQVRPGITGLAQVRGQRGQIYGEDCLAARLESDLEYVNKLTFTLDLKIILQSAFLVFTFHGE